MQDFPQDVKARERGGVGKGVSSVTAAAGALSRHGIPAPMQWSHARGGGVD